MKIIFVHKTTLTGRVPRRTYMYMYEYDNFGYKHKKVEILRRHYFLTYIWADFQNVTKSLALLRHHPTSFHDLHEHFNRTKIAPKMAAVSQNINPTLDSKGKKYHK